MPGQPEPDRAAKTRVVVLLSGSGRTLENLIRAERDGRMAVEFTRVISSRSTVRGVQVARDAGIPLTIVPRRRFETLEAFSDAVHAVLDAEKPDLVLMAGFLSRIAIPAYLAGRVMNIHPTLLPLFGGQGHYGMQVHERVLSSGMKISGCTVHFVDENYDAGPIILQACVPVLEDDEAERLAARVFQRECELYPEAVRLFASGRLRLEGNRVRILPPA
jgi:formyltetrahydrofolate-dependent phosphoribosylglycinamide formyltransferase